MDSSSLAHAKWNYTLSKLSNNLYFHLVCDKLELFIRTPPPLSLLLTPD